MTLCECMVCNTPGFPVLHHLPGFSQTHACWVDDAIQPSCLLLLPFPPALNLSQHQGLFQWVGSLNQMAKVLELHLQHQSFQRILRISTSHYTPLMCAFTIITSLHSSPLLWKGHLFWELVLEGIIGLHRTIQLQLLQHYSSGHRFGLLWYWMIYLGNRQRSFCLFFFEIAPKYCILDSFVDYDGNSISSKGFLPTVVDIMDIWVKFTHSSPF